MVNKQEIADSLQVPIAALLDAIRYIRISGTVDDAAVLVVAGAATYAVFRAPYACKIKSCVIRAEIVESTGGEGELIDLIKSASGTALTVLAGNKLIATITPTAAGMAAAATDYNCPILTTEDVNQLAEGDTVAFVIEGVSELSGLIYNLVIERL